MSLRSSTRCCIVLATLLLLGRADNSIDVNTITSWSSTISWELTSLGQYVTNVNRFQKELSQDAKVGVIDSKSLVQTIAKDIEKVLSSKVDAIQRIMDVAESSALSAYTAGDTPKEPADEDYTYKDAKNHTHVPTIYSEHFGNNVNLNYSAVHVPTTVYGRAKEVLTAIRWSDELDQTFKNNYHTDPSLSWQYFGSSTGFMRQYPAMNWKPNGSDPHDPDLFDCRTRSWYIEAATSPKDVLILVDTSGSMTGMRKEIARHVVNNILDTLGNNDYVNILKFSNITEYVVPCFGDSLVQANLANIRELKNGIAEMNTERIANFSMILTYAFELLEDSRMSRRGACCNQAIMLVTDGVPDNYKEIFQRYNWASNPDNPDQADMPVRIFTYLIGREVADVRDSRWMACANRGYFVHLSTLAEVRDQVLNYISVMARPLVLNLTTHPIIWTPAYADIADPKITDWLWDKKERNDQKERYWIYRRNKKFMYLQSEIEDYAKKIRKHPDLAGAMYKYRLMTSVSMPVFDRRENANITEQVLIKNAYWVEQTRETRIANLLGVAGTDVPIDEIKQLMLPHMLGVRGYAFIVTNNGFVLTHPDLRPVFQGILKPAYNSVDMAEVELVDGDEEARIYNDLLLRFREDVIEQKDHSDVHLMTKYHYDQVKRVGKIKRRYDSAKIANTPFTLVVSIPMFNNTDYTTRVTSAKDVRREDFDKNIRAVKYFEGKNWRIHPDWLYCKYHFENAYTFSSPEEELKHFLEKATQPSWKWGAKPSEQSAQSGKKPDDTESRYCNRDLISSIVYDASATEWFADAKQARDERGEEFFQRFGPNLSFVATRSGLTRWQDFYQDESEAPSAPPIDHFSRLYPRAIDEIWYKRAVEQYYVQPDTWVFSVPIDEDGATNTTLVTASRAVFVGNSSMKAPAAVVGFQMSHAALQGRFLNITSSCYGKQCERHCGSEEVDCFLVDNHGYIIAAKDASLAGRFLGSINGLVMDSLVKRGVYEKITVFDFQGVCFRYTSDVNRGNVLLTPFRTIALVASWLYGQLTLTLAKAGFWNHDYAEAFAYPHDGDMELDRIDSHFTSDEPPADDAMSENGNKPAADIKDDWIYDHFIRIRRTKPEPCDQQVDLYLLREITSANSFYDDPYMNVKGCDSLKYIVQPVNSTNMILLMIDNINCHEIERKYDTEPRELQYPVNSSTLACQKTLSDLPRRRPEICIRTHPKESEIKDLCGHAANARLDLRLFASAAILVIGFYRVAGIHQVL